MTKCEILAQAIGIVAMAFNILSYQQKTPIRVIGFQLFGSALFSVNFFMLGATVGGIMNLLGTFRALVYTNRKKLHADHPAWLAIFILLYLLSYVLTFACFGKEFTVLAAIIELLPVVAMTATTISFRLENAGSIRKFGLISSPSWLIYNITNLAIGAIVCEMLSLCSILIGMLRHDRNAKA